MAQQRWILRKQNRAMAEKLGAALNIHPLVAQVMLNRGISTVEEGKAFLKCDLRQTPDPFLMSGMSKAAARVQDALKRQEPIVIYGDYDADGQTATALLVIVLRHLAQDPALIQYYLPDRIDEGYGLHKEALSKLAKEFTLLITVDCGISAVAEIAYAQELGLDIIVTDHHEPGLKLPAAVAVLNPKQPHCPYPFKDLAGVGVAMKLVQALGVKNWQDYLDLVTLGTVADLVPLRGENRIWVSRGLERLAETNNLGIQALLQVSEVERPTAGDVGFRLGPRLNAAGRLGDPARGVRLFLTQDPEEARALAFDLHRENSFRQEVEAKVLAEAIEVVEKYRLDQRKAIVVWGNGWHQGVVGIVASRLVERYYLPTIVVSLTDGEGTASARSIAGLDLYQTLTECSHLLIRYGGHAMAAGLTVAETNLVLFQQEFEALCANKLTPEDYIPSIAIDAITNITEITPELVEDLACLEPHGIGNPGPTLQAKVAVVNSRVLGQENRHLRLEVQDEKGGMLPAIGFGLGPEQVVIEQSAENLQIAFVPRFNEWRNEKNLQLHIQAWQRGTAKGTYLEKWLIDYYPWQLPASYFFSAAFRKEQDVPPCNDCNIIDLRGTWDKRKALTERGNRDGRKLILVNTPAEVLELCRRLRIQIPGGEELIGFEHELLNPQEREEFEQAKHPWIVSTGYSLQGTHWPSVWLWHPPLHQNNYRIWASLVAAGGELVSVYGPKDVRTRQVYLKQVCPDRSTLAQIYARLRQSGGIISLAESTKRLAALGLLPAFPFALQIFKELKLWEIEDDQIIYQATPAQKLDLNQTVLYNKVTLMRKQSSDYLKRCLERGFCQDGLKREN